MLTLAVIIAVAALLLIALAGRILDAIDDAFDEDAKGPRAAPPVFNSRYHDGVSSALTRDR